MLIKSNKLIFFLLLFLLTFNLYSQTPQISVSNDSINFGEVEIDSGLEIIDTVYNTGSDTLEIWRHSLSGGGVFVASLNPYQHREKILPGEFYELYSGFYPDTMREYADSLVIASNDPSDPYTTIYYSGRGVQANISLFENTHLFGDVSYGDTATAWLYIENDGNRTLTVDSIITSAQCFWLDTTACTIDTFSFEIIPVYFAPDTGKDYEEIFYIYSDASNGSPIAYTVKGTGIAGSINFLSNTITLIQDSLSDTCYTTIPVKNDGTGNLIVSSYSIDDISGTFLLSGTTETITPGDTSTTVVTFDPDTTGRYYATLTIQSNALEGTQTMQVEGYSEITEIYDSVRIALSTNTLNFGNVRVGENDVLYDTVRSTGTDTLEIWKKSISSDPTVFISNLYPSHQYILPGEEKQLIIGFYPNEYRDYTDTLVIETNDPTQQYVSIYLTGSGFGKRIDLGETTHSFGNVSVYDTSTAQLTIQNIGNEILTVDSIVTSASNFWLDTTRCTVDTSSIDTITVYFLPDTESYYQEYFFIYSNADNDSIAEYIVTGYGVLPHISITDTVLNFGEVNFFDSLSVTVPVISSGTDSLIVSSYSLSGGTLFTLSDTSETIYAGDTSSINITFNPDTVGSYSDTLTISSNAEEGTKRVVLTGTGANPQIGLNADSIHFGDVSITSTSNFKLVISNNGSGTLEIDSIYQDSSFFDIYSYKNQITSGDTSIVNINFTPQNFTLYSDTVHIVSNDTGNTVISVPIKGTGAGSSINITQTSFGFDTLDIGNESEIRFYVKNTGNRTLTINEINSVTGFVISIHSGDEIQAGDSTRYDIKFIPTDKGNYSSMYIIESNAPLSPYDTLTVSGYCLEPEISLDLNNITFNNISAGEIDSAYLKVENTGNDTLKITAEILDVFNNGVFSVSESSKNIHPSSADSVKLLFIPKMNTGYFDTLKITSNAYIDTLFNIELLGNPDSNFVPFFIGKPDTLAYEDNEYSASFSVYNRDNDVLTYRLLTFPDSMLIDSVSGQIDWTPVWSDTGLNLVSVEVDDGRSGRDTLNFNLSVIEVNDTPVFTSSPPETAYVGVPYSYTPSVTDEEHSEFTFNLDAFPQTMSINDSTGQINWTPSKVEKNVPVFIRVTDPGGASSRQEFYIDVLKINFAPQFTSTPDTIAVEDNEYSYTFTASDSNNDDLYYSIISAPENANIDSVTGKLTWLPDNSNVGDNLFKIRVRDIYNAADTIRFYINVSNTNDAPELESQYNYTAYVDSLFSITINAVDIDPADTLFYYDNSTLFDIDSISGQLLFTPSENDTGFYQFKIWVTDKEASDTAYFNLNISLQNEIPVITQIPDTTIFEAAQFYLQVEAYDPDSSGILIFYDNTDIFDIDSTSGIINFTPSQPDTGIHHIQIKVYDGYNYRSEDFVLTIMNINQPPQVMEIKDTTIYEQERFYYTVNAEDPDLTDKLYYYDNTDLFTIDADSGIIDFTPQRSDTGEHSIEIRVSDGEYYDTTSFVLTVLPVNNAPVFVSYPDTVAIKGKEYTYQANVDDEDGDSVYFYLVNAPTGMEIDSTSGYIFWNVGLNQTGSYYINIKASDKKGGIVYQSFTITVIDVNYPPVINSTPDTTAVEDELYTYHIEAEDPENIGLNYVLVNAPENMKLDSSTICWTPSNDDVGVHSITIRVYDAAGDSASQSFNIYVTNVNDPPEWAVIPDTSIVRNSVIYISIYIYIEDPDNDFGDLTFSFIESSNLSAIFRDSSAFIYTTDTEFQGLDTLGIIAKDPEGLSDTALVKIEIISPSVVPQFVDDTLNITMKEDETKILTYKDWVIDSDNHLDELQFVFESTEYINLGISDSSNKLIYIKPVKDWHGSDSTHIIVKDPQENKDTMQTFITVFSVEDAPKILNFTPESDTTVYEGEEILFSCSIYDADGDSLSLSWYINGVETSTDSSFVYTAIIDTTGEKLIKLIVSDGKTDIEKTWKVTVLPPVGIENESKIVKEFRVFQNYPNPFNITTNIKVSLPERGNLSVIIYNIKGQKIKTVVKNIFKEGEYIFRWNGKNDYGNTISSGVYFYRVKFKHYIATIKLVLIK